MSGVRIANNVVGEDLKEENSIRRQVGLIIKTLLPDVLDLQKEYLYANCYLLQGVSGFVEILTPPLTLDRMVQS